VRWIYRNIWQGEYDPRDDESDIDPSEVEAWQKDFPVGDYDVIVATDNLVILSWKMGMSIHIYARVE